jgi:hypothetical protein
VKFVVIFISKLLRMFWGCSVSEGKPFALPEDSEYELLHISNASLSRNAEAGKVYLQIVKGAESFTIGSLQKDKVENLFLDLYVRSSQKIKLLASGKGEVHVTGYFEPAEEKELGDEEFGDAPIPEEDSEEEEEEESEEEIKLEAKAPKKEEPKKPVEAKKPAEQKKPAVEGKKLEQGSKKKKEEESDSDEDSEIDMEESEEEDADKLKKIVAQKKKEAEKPLVAPTEAKKPKIEGKPAQQKPVEAPKQPGAQGEGKKKKKNKNKSKPAQ